MAEIELILKKINSPTELTTEGSFDFLIKGGEFDNNVITVTLLNEEWTDEGLPINVSGPDGLFDTEENKVKLTNAITSFFEEVLREAIKDRQNKTEGCGSDCGCS